MSLLQKFWDAVIKTEDGCWEWRGRVKSEKLPSALIWDGTRYVKAHRVSFEIHNKTIIPENSYIHRTCKNRLCTNPDHLMMVEIETDPIIRFWKNVRKEMSCWIWIGVVANNGYGQASIAKPKRHMLAHRYSYELTKGKIPEGLLVCHTCDVKLCVNPDHLFLGTHLDNNRDAISKGRNAHGSKSPSAILSEEDASIIKHSSLRSKELTAKFGVGRSTISSIKLGKQWKHIL